MGGHYPPPGAGPPGHRPGARGPGTEGGTIQLSRGGTMGAGLAIELVGVRKVFDGRVAVDDLSLAVPVGSVFGLLGPNGAGKTTTIRMIMDILGPDRGE